MIQNYYPTDDDRRAIGEALSERDQPLTIEAIGQNPWRAVADDLPRDASAELAAEVVRVTEDLGVRAAKWGNRADDPDERERWHALANLAQISGENAALAHDLEVARAAWREPEFSRATIDADAWTAVRLPVPEQAKPELLAYARDWARDLGRYAEHDGAFAEPLVNAENFTREQNVEAAAQRVAALDERLELAREHMAERHRDEWELVHGVHGVEELPSQLEQRHAAEQAQLEKIIAGGAREAPDLPRDEPALEELLGKAAWRAVNEPIPRRADVETLEHLRDYVEYTIDRLDRLQRDAGTSDFIDQALGKATQRLEEIDVRLEAERTPELEQDRSHGAFLSPEFIARSVRESVTRTTEMLLNVVIGYFVPEPELTPEQARLATRANAERSEAWDFANARQENAAALDRVNGEIDRHRSHVQVDELARPDSIYERYPGLTRDDNDGRGREAEAERAFYDTGTERSRSRGI